MTYKNNNDLPDSVKNHLPSHAKDIYRKLLIMHLIEQYKEAEKRRGNHSREVVAHKVALSAVEKNTIKMIKDTG